MLEVLHTSMASAEEEIAGNHAVSHVDLAPSVGLGLQEWAFIEVIVWVSQLPLADDSSLVDSVDKILVDRHVGPHSMQDSVGEGSSLFGAVRQLHLSLPFDAVIGEVPHVLLLLPARPGFVFEGTFAILHALSEGSRVGIIFEDVQHTLTLLLIPNKAPFVGILEPNELAHSGEKTTAHGS